MSGLNADDNIRTTFHQNKRGERENKGEEEETPDRRTAERQVCIRDNLHKQNKIVNPGIPPKKEVIQLKEPKKRRRANNCTSEDDTLNKRV